MSNPADANATAVTSVAQLADYVASGCKPRDQFRIGTEHEKFVFRRDDLTPAPYLSEERDGRDIQTLLQRFAAREGQPILDAGNIVGLSLEGGSISLEPAGQFELSGTLLSTLHETEAEIRSHLDAARAIGSELGLGFLPLGFHPTARRDDMPWMPKGRYAVMRRYMPTVGSLGLDMMTRTCTVQVNLDFSSEDDMRRKLRVGLLLQPLATALFANSPLVEGRPSGYLSYRAHVWEDTDRQRSGAPPIMFEPDFGFRRYVEWLLDQVPMYFVYRDGRYIDVAGRRFRDFMTGRIPELAGIQPTVGDFADHMTTVFTDVRLKRFLEMRGADAGSPEMLVALPAFWVGLLYDPEALTAAEALVAGQGFAEYTAMRNAVPLEGLNAPWKRGTLRDLAAEIVPLAKAGLERRNRLDETGRTEGNYLRPLEAIAAGGPTQSERWLGRFNEKWEKSATAIFTDASI
ncbi:MAG: glutamate--cysteine ligase [Acetobacteraceae bacterium]|nr:glutamate--cysteine ligase [Acetobacteraceae bacterium]